MAKSEYQEVEIEVVEFEAEDVIVSSGYDEGNA